ncbi:16661_t:CDS:2, partial [Racocetra fulgida]
SCERIRVCLENCNVDKDIQTFVKERATGSEIPEPPSYVNFYAGPGENGTRYRKASYERTSVERVLPPSTDKPIGSPQSTKNANYNSISTTNSSQSSQGTDSALPQTPIEEVDEPDPIDPGQQTILAVGSNLLNVQATNETLNDSIPTERSIEKALDDMQNKEK